MGVKDDLLALAKATRKLVPVKVAELGGAKVWVRELTARERDEFDEAHEESNGKAAGRKEYRAAMLVRCLVNEDGTDMYGPADAGKINELPERVLGRLYAVCNRVNGVSEKQLEEALGN